MTATQLQVAVIALIVIVFALYVYTRERSLRSELVRLFKKFVERELPHHAGLSRETLFEAIVMEQVARQKITDAEASFLLKTVKYQEAR